MLKIQPDIKLPKNVEMLKLLEDDGVYIDDPEVYQKFTDDNV